MVILANARCGISASFTLRVMVDQITGVILLDRTRKQHRDMSCDCEFEPVGQAQRHVLVTLLAINGAMFFIEIVVGLFAHSSGVIADSLDMLANALVYGVGLYAIGKGRFDILAEANRDEAT